MSAPPPSPPRVVLLTSPGLFGAIIINTLAEHPGIHLVGVGLTSRGFKGKGPWGTLKAFIALSGWRYTWYGVVLSTIAWMLLRLTGRPAALRTLGENARPIPDVNSAETITWLKSLQPDYIASYYFNQWIGSEVRAAANKVCINVHPSLLPALRGPDPTFRALERGLTATGITIHVVDDGFDTGNILHQETRSIPPSSTHFSLLLSVIREGSQLLADWIAGATQPVLPIDPPPPSDYSTFPTAKEVAAFLKSGKRLLRRRDFWRTLHGVK